MCDASRPFPCSVLCAALLVEKGAPRGHETGSASKAEARIREKPTGHNLMLPAVGNLYMGIFVALWS